MKDLIVITGPTAVGKTSLSVKLAKKIGGEIISADSMQVYRGMDIGTAKIKPEETEGIPHHLIDIFPPDFPFNVLIFKEKVTECMKEIKSRGKVPILVGGTGFYIQAVLYDIQFTDTGEEERIRKEYETLLSELGAEKLHGLLEEVDPVYAAGVSPNNTKRVIRALSFYKSTGTRLSEHNETEREKGSPYDFSYFVLTMNRKTLYERIDERVDRMMKEGLIEEVLRLLKEGIGRDAVSMQGIGYKEVAAYLRGLSDLSEAEHLIKLNTRHFAKRQLTWFRREKTVTYIDKDIYDSDEKCLTQILNEIETGDRPCHQSKNSI